MFPLFRARFPISPISRTPVFPAPLVFPYSHRRWFARSARFLPFEEAREYVRSLGITKQTEWKEWLDGGSRPPYIPSHPATVYRQEGWISLPDWVGYEPRRAKFRQPGYMEAASEVTQSVNAGKSAYAVHHRYSDHFVNFMLPSHSRLELQRTTYKQHVQFLFWPRSPTTHDVAPLIVRICRQLHKGGYCQVGRNRAATNPGMVVIVGEIETARYFFLPSHQVEQAHLAIGPNSPMVYLSKDVLDRSEVFSSEELCDRLLEQYDSTRAADLFDGLQIPFRHVGPRSRHQEFLRSRLVCRLYAACGLVAVRSFPDGAIYDSIIGGHRIVHGVSHYDVTHRKLGVNFRRYISKNHLVPISQADEFDFFVVAVDGTGAQNSGDLGGAFIFPKHTLTRYLSAGSEFGVPRIPLYPPEFPASRSPAKERKEEQLRYYIDLSNSDTLDEQIRKAKAIFAARSGLNVHSRPTIISSSASPHSSSSPLPDRDRKSGAFESLFSANTKSCRGFGSWTGRFLEFEEARDWVRELGFTKYTEWLNWRAAGSRLPFIPYNPHQVYVDRGWISYQDWLGYEKRKRVADIRRNDVENALEMRRKAREDRPNKAMHLARASSAFLEHMSGSQRLEFSPLPVECHAQFLYRPRSMSSEHNSAWRPLCLRVRTKPEVVGGLGVGRCRLPTVAPMVIFAEFSNTFLFLPAVDVVKRTPPGSSSSTSRCYINKSDFDTFIISSPEGMADALVDEYNLSAENSKESRKGDQVDDDYLFHNSPHGRLYFMRMRTLETELYARLGLVYRFSLESEGQGDSDGTYNAMVGTHKVLHKSVIRNYTNDYILLQRQVTPGGSLPLGEEDNFEFVVALDGRGQEQGKLNGVFILPKCELSQAISCGDRVGTKYFALVFPWRVVKRRSTRIKQSYQTQFYIDLSNPDTLDEQVQKAKAIFDGSWRHTVELRETEIDSSSFSSAVSSGTKKAIASD